MLSKLLWQLITEEAQHLRQFLPLNSPCLKFIDVNILKFKSVEEALINTLIYKIDPKDISTTLFKEAAENTFSQPDILKAALTDLEAYYTHDCSCTSYYMPFLFYKGFHALQTHRVAHHLWNTQQFNLALHIQNLISKRFNVDIHPAAKIGHGTMFNHATGIVIGETTQIGNNVSIMQGVTLGGTGKDHEDRHPKIEDNVLIGSGAKILGNIRIKQGAKITSGSVVLSPVDSHAIVAGVPAKQLGFTTENTPSQK
jgi:serine O-acetyltransferase